MNTNYSVTSGEARMENIKTGRNQTQMETIVKLVRYGYGYFNEFFKGERIDSLGKLSKVTGLPMSTISARVNDCINLKDSYGNPIPLLKYEGFTEWNGRRVKKIVAI